MEVFLLKNNNIKEPLAAFFAKVPELDLSYIEILTNPTGIFQHAKFNIPDYNHGYCLDDNCRALLLLLKGQESVDPAKATKLISTYLAYIYYSQNSDGTFRNFMSYDLNFLESIGSDDSMGRTLWILGYLLSRPESAQFHNISKEIFDRTIPHLKYCKSVRAISFYILGLLYFLEKYPENKTPIHQLETFCDFLIHEYKVCSTENWHWFEEVISYDNAIIPLSLLKASRYFKNAGLQKIGLESADFLDKILYRNGHFAPIGNQNWYKKHGEISAYGQQPVEVCSSIYLYQELRHHNTQINCKERIRDSFLWFLGKNDLNISLFDHENIACYDGLEQYGINKNQGAESNIVFWLSYLEVKKVLSI